MDPNHRLTTAAWDRATGAVVGMAVGNALGNGYAFQPRTDPMDVKMRSGGLGPYEAGEWADDTAMAMPLVQALAEGKDLSAGATQDEVAAQWIVWFTTAKDVAPVISDVLSAYDPAQGAESLRRQAAARYADGSASTPGNASLMRTTPIALGFLHHPDALSYTARLYSELTHGNPEAADACVLLNLAQRHAILEGEFDLVAGLPRIPEVRQQHWEQLITRAEIGVPQDFAIHNGWASQLLQTVWSAICAEDATSPEHFEQTLRLVVAAGGDTATAGAIAGGLLGSRWGVSAIPLEWRRLVHGWPGWRDGDLQRAVFEALSGRPWPDTFRDHPPAAVPVVPHPGDPGVLLGDVSGLRALPAGVDAVVSLCRVGYDQMPQPAPSPGDHLDVWLVDSSEPEDNPNLDLVAEQTVELLSELRDEGRTVYLHCSDGTSRTPFIAALYGARIGRASALEVLQQIQRVAPHARPNPLFVDHLRQAE